MAASMQPQDSSEACWFALHLQPHESLLRLWLRSRFPRDCDVDDIVQEAFVRVLQARGTAKIESPKAFLFATARNLALHDMRRRRMKEKNALAETAASGILDESADIPQEVARAEERDLLVRAILSLPTRCRQIVTLRKIYSLSQKEVAAKLGISEHTVEAQSAIGLRKLSEFFARIERRKPFRHE